jgi:hypothetical protein
MDQHYLKINTVHSQRAEFSDEKTLLLYLRNGALPGKGSEDANACVASAILTCSVRGHCVTAQLKWRSRKWKIRR